MPARLNCRTCVSQPNNHVSDSLTMKRMSNRLDAQSKVGTSIRVVMHTNLSHIASAGRYACSSPECSMASAPCVPSMRSAPTCRPRLRMKAGACLTHAGRTRHFPIENILLTKSLTVQARSQRRRCREPHRRVQVSGLVVSEPSRSEHGPLAEFVYRQGCHCEYREHCHRPVTATSDELAGHHCCHRPSGRSCPQHDMTCSKSHLRRCSEAQPYQLLAAVAKPATTGDSVIG